MSAGPGPIHTVDIAGPDGPGGTGERGGKPVALKVVVVAGPDEGREVSLDATITIGSDPGCQLVLTDPAVSRKHVTLSVERSGVVVRDLGSRNGTFLASTKIKEVVLPTGAVLTVGQSAITVQPRWYVRELPPSPKRSFGELLGESLAMREIFAVLERVAPTDVTVLVEGESGTGKELVARSIHAASSRASKPYVVFDCGAVPAELAESELFGHKRGAFSGAVADRVGAFARADGGTLCLDELGELPLDLQPKLLRVLESGEIKPVGSDAPKKVDVRLVASTNRELHAEVRRGRFRADLMYRLEVVKLRLPPLRQRPEDVSALVAKLLEGQIAAGEPIGGENLRKLVGYGWPGNVRELRNTLARAVALATVPGKPPPRFADLVLNLGPASSAPSTIGAEYPGVSSPVTYKEAKEQVLYSFHRAFVTALLDRHKGNVRNAAEAAGLSRKHLYELIRRVEGEDARTRDDDDEA
ncbi:MAG: Nitrogen regulation protein NtrC [Labilithrix sp.]|nr:Nitrogen regulation protein NtrC [Labilithrix sp.]